MIFSLSILIMGMALIVFLVAILNQGYSDKVTVAFMEEMKRFIGGTISEYKILYYQLKLNGTYEGRQVECRYRRYPRQSYPYPQVLFALTPLRALEIKHFPFVYPTIARGIKLKNGKLECKLDVIQYPKPSQADLKAILDGLVQAEKNLKNRENDA